MSRDNITIIICCAGMGTRLGIGTTKALVDICGEPLISRQFDILKDYSDIRVVVGYHAESVINVINNLRKDIMFCFNHEYKRTGAAASLAKGLVGAKEYVICMDGDFLITQADFEKLVNYDGECLAISKINIDEPIRVVEKDGKVTDFSIDGDCGWSGLAKIKTQNFKMAENHTYEMIEHLLPLPALEVNSCEIDTQDDYEKAIEWFKRNIEGGYRQ